MRAKTRKDIVANSITIVDDEGTPKIGMYAVGKSGYAGISFYKGKGKERYEALQIYITDHHQGHIEIWHQGDKTALSLGATKEGVGLSVFDPQGRHLKAFGAIYSDLKAPTKGKKKARPSKSK